MKNIKKRGTRMGTVEIVFLSLTIMLVLTFVELFRIPATFDYPPTVWNYIEVSMYVIAVMVCWYVILKEYLK